jgi:hypothetical protein
MNVGDGNVVRMSRTQERIDRNAMKSVREYNVAIGLSNRNTKMNDML